MYAAQIHANIVAEYSSVVYRGARRYFTGCSTQHSRCASRAHRRAAVDALDLLPCERTRVARRRRLEAKARELEGGRPLARHLIVSGNSLDGALAHRVSRRLVAARRVAVGLADDAEGVAVVRLADEAVRRDLGSVGVEARRGAHFEEAPAGGARGRADDARLDLVARGDGPLGRAHAERAAVKAEVASLEL